MTTATANGRPQRKQLADQLDRLDAILDVLADGLPEAVGDAVRAGTRTALKDLLTEILTDPATLALLRRAIAPPPATSEIEPAPRPDGESPFVPVDPPRPSFRARCQAAFQSTTARIRQRVRAVSAPLTDGIQAIRMLTPDAELGRAVRRAAIVALLLGGAALVLALTSHPVATALSAVGMAVTAFSVQTAVGAHRLVRRLLD